MKITLLLALIVSITVNVWLFRQWQYASETPLSNQKHSQPSHSEERTGQTLTNNAANVTSSAASSNENAINSLKQMLNAGRYSELRYELQQRLRLHPGNIELLLLEAELMMKTEPLNDALLHYYSLLRLPLTHDTESRIQQRIAQLLRETIDKLKEAQSWDLLAQFLEPLFQQLPPDKQIILTLAEAYGQQRKYTLMEDTLASLLPHDAQVKALRQRLRETEVAMRDEPEQQQDIEENEYQVIPLQRHGDHFLIDVAFGPVSTTLLIDTGASTTAVTQRIMNAITSQQHTIRVGVFTLQTAAGTIESEMNQVFDVLIGEFSFPELNVMTLHNTSMSNADGLLGMNVLRHFEFRIDQQRSVLLLKLNPTRS